MKWKCLLRKRTDEFRIYRFDKFTAVKVFYKNFKNITFENAKFK